MRITILIVFLLSTNWGIAQQLPLLAQYRENHILLNPAGISVNYINNNSAFSAGVLGRYQWVGLEDAPKTQTAYGSYFWEDKNVAFGGYLVNDQTGPLGFSGAYAQFGYLLELNRYGHKLSFGINAGLVQYRANVFKILPLLKDPDPIQTETDTEFFPDFGFGMYYHFDKHFYIGISVPQIFGLNLNHKTPSGDFQIKRMQHGYFHTGGYFGIGEKSFLEPALWIQYARNAPLNINLNLRALFAVGYNLELWAGGGYSSSGIAHLETGFTLVDVQLFGAYDGLKFGISYDYTIANYALHLSGAYELHVGYYMDI